jgi:hypothetical protein
MRWGYEMNTASLELCKELYKLKPEWDTEYWITSHGLQKRDLSGYPNQPDRIKTLPVITADVYAPAYTLDYLIRKLPPKYMGAWLELWKPTVGWAVGYDDGGVEENEYPTATADTTEDALCKLAIKLIKEGTL